jgi:hypothetical protein
MAAAIPIVVTANNEQYAQFALSLVAVFGFMLSGYNGMIPSAAILDQGIVQLLPNVLATREIAVQLVVEGNATGSEPSEAGSRLALLAGYSTVTSVFGVLLARWQLYNRGILR